MRSSELALAAIIASASLASAAAQDPPASAPEAGGGLPPGELERRKEALGAWTFEPVAIDSGAFLLHVDRRDGSFFLEDRRAGVRWFSSWGRRGFASVLVEGDAVAGGAPSRWVRIDQVKDLASEERKVRFTGGSREADLPPVRFRFEYPSGSERLLIEVELPAESRGRISRVRILEDALWVSSAAGGGALVPAGAGEWHPVGDAAEMRRRLEGIGAVDGAPAGGGALRWSLSSLGLVQASGPLLVRWDDPRTVIDVARKPMSDASFPGKGGIFTSIEFPVPRGESGPFTAGVELTALGRSEQDPLVSLVQAAREIQTRGLGQSTLRWKTGTRPELRAFVGAAVIRARAGASPRFADVAAYAERLRNVLAVDQAAFVLGGWSAGETGGTRSALLPASAAPGGDAGLKECARRIKDLGFIFGLELDMGALLHGGETGAAGAAAAWNAALEAARREENLPALADLCAPQLLVLREPARALSGADSAAALDARGAFVAHVRDTFGLAGLEPGGSSDVPAAAYLEGLLGGFARDLPGKAEPWPFFPAVFGHCARLSAGSAPLGADGAREFLALLLAGELPVYGIPAAPGAGSETAVAGDARWCFAREGGWTAGKGLSPEERFLKNTFEVASRVARTRTKEIFFHHRSVTPDGRVRETRFGFDLRVLVNFGPGDHVDEDDGVVLPPMGFLVKHPFLLAFHARRANGVDYEEPAFFVVHSLEGKMYLLAEKARIYHGFGPDVIQLGGKTFRVEREEDVKIW